MQLPPELWPTVCRLAGVGEWPPREPAARDAFFNFAIRDGLFPLLMADADVPPETEEWKPRFRALQSLYRKRYAQSRFTAQQVAAVLGPNDMLFEKGADYRHRVYASPELRPMQDIDVLLPLRSVASVAAQFAAAGHRRVYSAHGKNFAPSAYELAFVVDGALVEVHRSIGLPIRARIDYAGLWQRRQRFEADGVQGCRLAPADAILADAYNLAKDEFSVPLIRLVDLHHLLMLHAAELPLCVARAKAWGIECALFGALHLVMTIFTASATPAIREAVSQLLTPARRAAVARLLPDPRGEAAGHTKGRAMQVWRKFGLIDQPWRRGAFAMSYATRTAAGWAQEWRLRRTGAFAALPAID